MMGSLRKLHQPTCRQCGKRLIGEERGRNRDYDKCVNCWGIELFGAEGWTEYRRTQDEIARLVPLIEQWDQEDVRDFQTWLIQLQTVVDDQDVGDSIHNYVDLPHPSVPVDLRWVVTAIDRHGRCLVNGTVLSSLDEYRPDKAEVSRLVGLIEQWDHEDVRDLKDWLLDLQGILSPSGYCVRDYVSLPSVAVPEGIKESIAAIDRRGRCLMDDYVRVSTLIRLRYPDD